MSAPAWDAGAGRVLCEADALFAASNLAWFDAVAKPWDDDPWSAFERLIREALATAGRDAQAPASPPAAYTPLPPRPFSATVAAGPAAFKGVTASDAPLPLEPAPRMDFDAEPQQVVSSKRSMHVSAGPAYRRAARAAVPGAQDAAIAAPASVDRAFEPPAVREIRLPAESAAQSFAATSPDIRPSLPQRAQLSHSSRVLRLASAPRTAPVTNEIESRAATASIDSAPLERARSQPVRPAEAVPRPTRLVAGVPALQNLLQSALSESRERHALAATHVAPPPPGPAAPSATASPPAIAARVDTTRPAPHAVPALDPVAEDMLVDRLAERLQERMREQALRQLGFTGGLI